ncbi:MAG TPA: phytoene/squalene synthase family protein [Chthoniobacterales bacterium]
MRPGSSIKNAAESAEQITRASQSNLALAFVSLGGERRRDITLFYAFCRLIDDIADDPQLSVEEKARELTRWRDALTQVSPNEPPLAAELRNLFEKYAITPAMLAEIIDGVEMDLTIARYETFAALREYCYRVASAVGLVSIEIFGYRNPVCREYAVELGLALQTTNIIRDVAKDLANGRIYLPQEDMAQFDYSEADLRAKTYDERFVRLMHFEADRAQRFFARAAALLPREDRRSMVGAEIMASIYRALLQRMERDRFRVFERDYRLNRFAKSFHVLRRLLWRS